MSETRILLSSSPPLRIAPMTAEDVDVVATLARRCFPTPWLATTFARDLQDNARSSYWVVRIAQGTPPEANQPNAETPIVAYGATWLMGDEIHVVTLATDPDWQRRGIGTWLLLFMLAQARQAGGRVATLEVRESNEAARHMYERLGFTEVGRRRGYYTKDTRTGEREDALLLELARLDVGAVWRPLAQMLDALAGVAPSKYCRIA